MNSLNVRIIFPPQTFRIPIISSESFSGSRISFLNSFSQQYPNSSFPDFGSNFLSISFALLLYSSTHRFHWNSYWHDLNTSTRIAVMQTDNMLLFHSRILKLNYRLLCQKSAYCFYNHIHQTLFLLLPN